MQISRQNKNIAKKTVLKKHILFKCMKIFNFFCKSIRKLKLQIIKKFTDFEKKNYFYEHVYSLEIILFDRHCKNE